MLRDFCHVIADQEMPSRVSYFCISKTIEPSGLPAASAICCDGDHHDQIHRSSRSAGSIGIDHTKCCSEALRLLGHVKRYTGHPSGVTLWGVGCFHQTPVREL